MKCSDIISMLEAQYPPSCAEDWDNPGLLLGRRDREVRKIFVTLDVTDETLEAAVKAGADMIVSHHPLIFGSIRQINDDSFLGRRLLRMAEAGISYYAMHTNFDIRGMADLNAAQLELLHCRPLTVTGETEKGPEGLGRIGSLPSEISLGELAEKVRDRLGLEKVRLYGDPEKKVQLLAVCGGSGKSLVGDAIAAGAGAMVTGDIDYHTAIDCGAQGLSIIDAGHYGTESCFVAHVAAQLRQAFPGLEILEAEIRQPYRVI